MAFAVPRCHRCCRRHHCHCCCCLTRTHSSASRRSPPDGVLAGVEVWLQLEGGRRLVAFPLPDGSFSFSRVPLGVHTLGVEHRTLVFPAVKLDVGTSRTGKVAAAAADVPGVSELRGSPLALRVCQRKSRWSDSKLQGGSVVGCCRCGAAA